jgi:uncharacterized protein YbcC (UPF0753/DUF2309 family)
MDAEAIRDEIERAAASVATAWPLHSFVAANPLAGFEDRPFPAAVRAGERLFGARGYPSAETFRRAWATGRIDPELLSARLADHGYDDADPEALLDRMAASESESESVSWSATRAADGPEAQVEHVLTTWLAAALDEGRADWAMPGREAGFYDAVRSVAPHDRRIPDRTAVADLPDDPIDAIRAVLADHPSDRPGAIFEHQFAALPGWTGLIRHRVAAETDRASACPVTLAGYLAVRLVLVDLFDAPVPVEPPARPSASDDGDAVPLAEIWLGAWEATYRDELVAAVADAGRSLPPAADRDDDRPAAQLAFCIDTRSEPIRRHVERAGPYETRGYAGFFGIPMRYESPDAPTAVDACPPIVDADHRIADRPTDGPARAAYDRWSRLRTAGRELRHALGTNPGTAFGFVETAGIGYGLALTARTLLPTRVADVVAAVRGRVPDVPGFCTPTVDHEPDATGELPLGLTPAEQVEYAATAFELTGWTEFARIVAFVGHASETTNNPFAASLDCGACAGNPGGPNARVLATICNDQRVRAGLRERGHEIPADTVFLAGEHDTTTDEITLHDGAVPGSHAADLDRLRADLADARAGAAAERAGDRSAGIPEAERRAADWAEPRPEWGLAGNAAFVIGRRALTAGLDLDGRVFLHSYDPTTDSGGDALDAILAGPAVVTRWINAAYYFATVDPDGYGSGSKVTQNPVGNVGVYQGNGGDLATGLPLQSVRASADEPYHRPLRLSLVVEAPVERVAGALERNDHLLDLLDGGWLSLTAVDPGREHRAVRYDGDGAWTPARPAAAPAETPAPGPAAED